MNKKTTYNVESAPTIKRVEIIREYGDAMAIFSATGPKIVKRDDIKPAIIETRPNGRKSLVTGFAAKKNTFNY